VGDLLHAAMSVEPYVDTVGIRQGLQMHKAYTVVQYFEDFVKGLGLLLPKSPTQVRCSCHLLDTARS